MFYSYIHCTVYAMNKTIIYFLFHIGHAHSLLQYLGRFRKPASQLIKYAHIDPIADFFIYVILAADSQARGFKLGTTEAQNKIINISSGFYEYRKIIFLAMIWRVF